jgi:mannose-6-phosphate isomerase-like protein (cupin superfamily)
LTDRSVDQPFVVTCNDIPASSTPDDLEVRPFATHDLLGTHAATEAVALAFMRGRAGHDVGFRSHPDATLIVVIQGRAELIGQGRRPVTEGDVITIPPRGEYGFTAVGPEGFQALQVTFRESRPRTDEVLSVDHLLARHRARGQEVLATPWSGALRRDSRQAGNAWPAFCVRYRAFLCARQAMSLDEPYRTTFEAQLRQELAQDLPGDATDRPQRFDPQLDATGSWFCEQMFLLDSPGRVVVSVVLQTVRDHLGTGGDRRHGDTLAGLLEGHHPYTYRRLLRVLDESWDMVEGMIRRMAQLLEPHGPAGG